MNQSHPQQQLENILDKWTSCLNANSLGLVGVLQFGSTIKSPLKKETDLDLFLIFETLPQNRMEQFDLTLDVEDHLNHELKKIKDHNIQVSFIVKSVDQLDHLSSFYLDFIDTSKIWYDPQNHLKKLLINITNWINQNGSYKVKRGSLWYWVYSPDKTKPVSFKFKK